jgi:pimeloyl-ACP methyl ester carboxylesterase
LGLVAGLVSVAVSACGSSPVKPTVATASVVSAPVRIAHTRLGAVGYRVVGSGPPAGLDHGLRLDHGGLGSAAGSRPRPAQPGGDVRQLRSWPYAATQVDAYVAFKAAISEYPAAPPASAGTKGAQSIAEADWWAGTDAAGRKIARISAPALIADGVADQFAPVANDHILARLIPAARLVLYPDAGHGFLFQHGTPFAPSSSRS